MKISFHGAGEGVTGSCHLLDCAGKRVLIDCGMYQGGRELAEENADEFGFDRASIDFLLLTHAHLDHCGRIPLLVKRGFGGEIITTAASVELARLVMLDSAGLQEERVSVLLFWMPGISSGQPALDWNWRKTAAGIAVSCLLAMRRRVRWLAVSSTAPNKCVSLVKTSRSARVSIPSVGSPPTPTRQNCSPGTNRPETPKTTFLVHGEQRSMHAFAKKLAGTIVEIPSLHAVYQL